MPWGVLKQQDKLFVQKAFLHPLHLQSFLPFIYGIEQKIRVFTVFYLILRGLKALHIYKSL